MDRETIETLLSLIWLVGVITTAAILYLSGDFTLTGAFLFGMAWPVVCISVLTSWWRNRSHL